MEKIKAEIVHGIFDERNPRLAEVLREITGAETPRVMLIADLNVVQHTEGLGVQIGRYVQANSITLSGKPVVLTGGEKLKTAEFGVDRKLMQAILEAKIGHHDAVIVLGGGSLLDVAGYAAAQVRGGVPLVRIPTTVSSMLSGCYADEAALDGCSVKDAFRISSIPAAVLIDPAFAKTVLDGVWRAGFSEAVRLAAVCDAKLLRLLEKDAEAFRNRDFSVWEEILEACAKTRAKKSPGSFGLWGALRLEAMSGYKLPHGYAVAIGVVIDAFYAQISGFIEEKDVALIRSLLQTCGAWDGAQHSRHLISQCDNILYGLDGWRLGHDTEALDFPKGIGKKSSEEKVERETMKKALNMIK